MARSRSWQGALAFGAGALAVAASFVLAGMGLSHWQTWQAESFGDRRLATPTAAECGIVRAVLRDGGESRAALLASVGAFGEPMALRAFAWWSRGARTSGGADWRGCHGLGPYVRSLGMARFASGEMGPMLYVSRATVDGADASVFETFLPPKRLDGVDVEARLSGAARSWVLRLQRTSDGGGWRVISRTDVAPPT